MMRVMVVDDHTIFRQGIVSLLNSAGICEVVAEAGSGLAAVDLAREIRPDIIVMDITMPDIDGIEAAKRIKAAGIDTGIILLTMHKGAELLKMAEDTGIQGYLLKDDALSDLLYAIKAVSRGEKFTSMSVKSGSRPRAAMSPPSSLTRREVEIIALVAGGLSSREIAAKLFISVKTVETHRSNVMEKLGLKNLPELVKYALRRGIIAL
ncbi:MAG: DNA-binding response regulator [Deltaproteobacteria bacterium HGW-Deltaproteobacteria-15]|nr:MAG: DNA-binding response regulator [Deltaproteobacteria bacterium HGW-Deltaproteobacteria-15]